MSSSLACKHVLPGSGSNDFVHHRTEDGRAFRTLNILDEYSRECLAIRVKQNLNSKEAIDALTDLFILLHSARRAFFHSLGVDNGLRHWFDRP